MGEKHLTGFEAAMERVTLKRQEDLSMTDRSIDEAVAAGIETYESLQSACEERGVFTPSLAYLKNEAGTSLLKFMAANGIRFCAKEKG